MLTIKSNKYTSQIILSIPTIYGMKNYASFLNIRNSSRKLKEYTFQYLLLLPYIALF
jgi:hypothetical protein